MPMIEFTELDLNRLEDAPNVVTLPLESCEDIDGFGNCYCALPSYRDPTVIKNPDRTMPLQHLVFYGTKVDGTPFTSRRYYRL